MFLEIVLVICFGVASGIITGLIPGIHINLISATLVSLSTTLLQLTTPFQVALFIVAMSITHSFTDAIPSTFLGAPDPDKTLTALPAHKMVLEGYGYDAIRLTLVGSLGCLIIGILLTPLFYLFLKQFYEIIQKYIFYILSIAITATIFLDKRRLKNMSIFLFAGGLGLTALNYSQIKDPLFPLLSGMFGISILLTSLEQNTTIPNQTTTYKNISIKETIQALLGGTIAGGLTSFLPGLGSSQGAALIKKPFSKLSEKGFIMLVGGINTINFTLSIIAFYTIEKARNGSIIGITHFISEFNIQLILFFLLTAILTGSIVTIISLSISKIIGNYISKVPYKKVVIGVIVSLIIMTFILSNVYGFILLIASTSLGIITEKLGVAKTQLMGCLLFPTLLYFSPI